MKQLDNKVQIAFLGDISLNDDYVQLHQKGEHPFGKISSDLKIYDYVIGNLECMAEGTEGENELKKPRLKTTTKTLNYLNDINLKCVLLAHNHIYDNLTDGYNKTIMFLKNNNIEYLGAGISKEEAHQPLIKNINGINICFLNYVTKDTNPKLPKDAKVYLNHLDKSKVISDIKRYRKDSDYIVLLLHWGGGHEGGYFPEMYQPSLAKEFIDNGADLIIGNHSHTFQPYEVYKEKYIFYSLGNFCFSNAYDFGYEINQNRATKSVILDVLFDKKGYKVIIKPIVNNNGYISIDDKLMAQYKKRQKLFYIMKNIRPIWIMYHYYHKYLFPIYYYFLGNNRNPIDRVKTLKFEKIKYYFFRR